ncbi:MAG: hypothetical protein ACJAS1_004716 [Oleiphilaceae bacterium]|jgi:hypothetical protein
MDVWSGKTITQDLSDYVDIIKKHEATVMFNPNPLLTLAEMMPYEDYCSIENIEIEFYNYKPISKTVPKIGYFKINLINSLKSKVGVDVTVNDPIKECTFDMIVTGFCTTDNITEYKMAWHLDKDEEVSDEARQKYTHPLYHFQYGGRNMDGLTTGDVMLMGAPRLPHPPMDIFLSIHFILNNYFNKEECDYSCLKLLFSDDDYIAILERAKERMWYPYFNGLSRTGNSHQELNIASLFPLAV